LATQAASRSLQQQQEEEAMYQLRFEQWIARYGREYKDADEKAKRYSIFKANVERIESFNKATHSGYKLGVNQFADLTNDEFKLRNRFKSHVCSTVAPSFRYQNVTAVPATVDWRKNGAVTAIKDQGQCGKHAHIIDILLNTRMLLVACLLTTSQQHTHVYIYI